MTATKARYLTTAETAKLVRERLKAEFPGVRFSVRSQSYSGGSSIHVGWLDGRPRVPSPLRDPSDAPGYALLAAPAPRLPTSHRF